MRTSSSRLLAKKSKVTFEELTLGNWEHFKTLFGARGACGGCWCMYWRSRAAEYAKDKGSRNRDKMSRLVKQHKVLGVLAISHGEAIGWCSVSPRDELIRLQSSRTLRRIDDEPVWSITCFFIKREFRKKGLSGELAKAALELARKHGAQVVEAYPIDTAGERYPDVFAFTGFYRTFNKLGFTEVSRSSATRPILRKDLTTSKAGSNIHNAVN